MWSALKHIMGKSASNKSNSNVLTANQINTFFATVGSNLAEKFTFGIATHIPSPSNFPTSIHTFKFSTIDTEEVFKLLPATGTKPKLDILEFDNYLVYLSAAFIAKPLMISKRHESLLFIKTQDQLLNVVTTAPYL